MKLKVRLNGSATNPYHRMGLRMNPFPQIAKAELDHSMFQVNSLDGDPLTGEADIRARLAGWSEEFIALCVANYRPGERVGFVVDVPDEFIG